MKKKQGYMKAAAFKFFIPSLARREKGEVLNWQNFFSGVEVTLSLLVCLGTMICASFVHAAINRFHKTKGAV